MSAAEDPPTRDDGAADGTALLLKLRLFVRKNTSVLDVPYHLDDPEPLETDRR